RLLTSCHTSSCCLGHNTIRGDAVDRTFVSGSLSGCAARPRGSTSQHSSSSRAKDQLGSMQRIFAGFGISACNM
ncbi:unnamed protein product, partial [Ectocarpus sp. 4 AP-2014]